MQWDMNKRPSVQEIENHLFLKGFEISGVLNENMESVVKNPFLKGSINPETIYVSTRVQESITENHQKNGTSNCIKVVTNPFLKGWIDPNEINENTSTQNEREKSDEQKSILNNSSELLPMKDHGANKNNNNFPVVGKSEENNASLRRLLYFIDVCNNELTNKEKKTGIKVWFKKKWNRIFRKENHDDWLL